MLEGKGCKLVPAWGWEGSKQAGVGVASTGRGSLKVQMSVCGVRHERLIGMEFRRAGAA